MHAKLATRLAARRTAAIRSLWLALADAIGELKQQQSILIIVGHRPSTLAQADKILVIKDGCSAMFGPRDEVMRVLTEVAPAPVTTHPHSTANDRRTDGSAQNGPATERQTKGAH